MTSRRFPHYLRPAGSGRWPQAILCVDAASVSEQVDGPQITRKQTLTGWYATLLFRINKSYELRYNASGRTADDWWQTLTRTLERTQCILIVSYRACRVWALLGLWESIENGQTLLVETRSRAEMRGMRNAVDGCSVGDESAQGWPGGNVSGMLGKAPGFLVTGDPPNILRARIADQARWWTWVDLRNYGVELAECDRSGPQTLVSITSAVQSICSALNTYKMGGLRATAGAQALAGYRSSYYGGGIYCHNHKIALALESNAYYGGRCEVRSIGVCGGIVYHLDFRSLYPSCCANNPVPARLITHMSSGCKVESIKSDCGIGTIAEVDIETEEPAYPYRRRVESGSAARPMDAGSLRPAANVDTDIIYPVGRFRTVLAGPEIQDALERSRVKRVHQLALYEMEPALHEYAIAMHNMRSAAERNGESTAAQLAKMLSVCISGKFGQRLRIWEHAPNVIAHVPYGEWWGADHIGNSIRYRSIGWTVWCERILGWTQEACPAIAAWITSAARMELLSAIRCAGWDNVYYYDTDSLFTNEVGYGRLVAANRLLDRTLGFLQFKGVSDYASFNGIKDYTFGDTLRSAGTPKGYYADAGDGRHFWYDTNASTDIKRGRRPEGSSILGHYYRDGEYRHGVVHDDGRVTPFVFEEW